MKLKAFFGVACPSAPVPLLQAACLIALALCVLTAGGCDSGGIGLNTPGVYDKIELGKPLPADVWQPTSAPRLGVSSCQSKRQAFAGESARELVRAAVDANGNVVASHCLRTWKRKALLGPGQDVVHFTLDLRVPGMSETSAPGAAGQSAPQAVFVRATTVPAATTRASTRPTPLRVAPASAPAQAGPLSAGAMARASDAPLDEALLAVAKAQALGKAPRPGLPGNWQEFGAAVLAQLNQERKSEHLPHADAVAASVADLVLLAEMMLQAIPIEGGQGMDRFVWKKLDLPDALRRVPLALPDMAGGESTWSHVEFTDAAGAAITMEFPYAFHGTADRTRFSATLANLGQGHVRVILQAERLTGLAQ